MLAVIINNIEALVLCHIFILFLFLGQPKAIELIKQNGQRSITFGWSLIRLRLQFHFHLVLLYPLKLQLRIWEALSQFMQQQCAEHSIYVCATEIIQKKSLASCQINALSIFHESLDF